MTKGERYLLLSELLACTASAHFKAARCMRTRYHNSGGVHNHLRTKAEELSFLGESFTEESKAMLALCTLAVNEDREDRFDG